MPLMNILRRFLACNDSEIMIACPLISMPSLVSQITSVSFERWRRPASTPRLQTLTNNASIFDEHSSTYGSNLHLKFKRFFSRPSTLFFGDFTRYICVFERIRLRNKTLLQFRTGSYRGKSALKIIKSYGNYRKNQVFSTGSRPFSNSNSFVLCSN